MLSNTIALPKRVEQLCHSGAVGGEHHSNAAVQDLNTHYGVPALTALTSAPHMPAIKRI